MDGGTTTCPLDVSNNASTVNKRDSFFNDVWGQGCNSFGNWFPNAENKCIHLRWQWWATKKESKFDWRTKRECNGPIGLLPVQAQARLWYQCKAKAVAPGDLVLRKVLGTTKNLAWGKLGPNWEGPYRITSVPGIGAYYLEDLDEKTVLHPWNVNNLKRYYYE